MISKTAFNPYTLTRIPVNAPGVLYRSPMPFSQYDDGDHLLDLIVDNKVSDVFFLLSAEEDNYYLGRPLETLYDEKSINASRVSTEDFGVPEMEELKAAARKAERLLIAGKNVVVHCHAGIGRTGAFLACLLGHIERIDAENAIRRVRAVIPFAIESRRQENFVHMYYSRYYKRHWLERRQKQKRRRGEKDYEKMRVRGNPKMIFFGRELEGRLYPQPDGTAIVVYKYRESYKEIFRQRYTTCSTAERQARKVTELE